MKRMKQEKEMEREAALKYLAEGIWTMGEIRNGHGCIVPSDWYGVSSKSPTEYNRACDVILFIYDVTHYDRVWKEKGKTVTLNFYRGDCFGACIDVGKIVSSVEVKVG